MSEKAQAFPFSLFLSLSMLVSFSISRDAVGYTRITDAYTVNKPVRYRAIASIHLSFFIWLVRNARKMYAPVKIRSKGIRQYSVVSDRCSKRGIVAYVAIKWWLLPIREAKVKPVYEYGSSISRIPPLNLIVGYLFLSRVSQKLGFIKTNWGKNSKRSYRILILICLCLTYDSSRVGKLATKCSSAKLNY